LITTGKRSTWNMGEVKELREMAELGRDVNLHNVGQVVDRLEGDFDLALDALTMSPRPAWVSELLRLHPDRKA
jgi:hypothetical protein